MSTELEKNLAEQMQEYEDLTRKYELLEEDYVVIKAQMVMEKEQIEGCVSLIFLQVTHLLSSWLWPCASPDAKFKKWV